MFGNRSKLKKIKSIDDVYGVYNDLTHKVAELDISGLSNSELLRLLTQRLINVNRYMELLGSDVIAEDITRPFNYGLITLDEYKHFMSNIELSFNDERAMNQNLFIHNEVNYDEYVQTEMRIDRDEGLANIQKRSGSTIGMGYSDDIMEPYAESNVEYQYEKIKLLHSFRMGRIDSYEYDVKLADLNDEPYVAVIFSPVDHDDTSKLSVDARFNDKFISNLHTREEYTPKYDENDEIIGDELVEQWFHTAVIVMAANMLKETDLDIFRSVSEDNPGISLIEKLEFDDSSLEDLSDVERSQIKNIEEHGRIYY